MLGRVGIVTAWLVVAGCSTSVAPSAPAAPSRSSTADATLSPTPRPTLVASPTSTADSGAAVQPPACGDAVLEWDGERVVLATCVSQGSGQESDQIWAHTVDGWSLVSDAGPPAVVVSSAAWDARRRVLVRYGGQPMDSNACVPDTWEWNGADWSQPAHLENPRPTACDHMKLVYDPALERVLMVGGGDDNGDLTHETWAWDGVDWSQVDDDGPAGRAHHGLVWDANHSQVLLYGGYDGNQVFDDFWAWDGQDWNELQFSGPGPRSHFGMALNDNAELLLVGGATGPQSFATMVADTWLLTDGRWRPLEVEGPAARLSPALGFDRARDVWVLYGGFDAAGGELGDTWQFDGSAWECVDGCEV